MANRSGIVGAGVCYLQLLLLVAANDLSAAEAGNKQSLPGLELLEFLGSFATEAGEWIDPNSLLDEELSALLDAYSRQGNGQDTNEPGQTDELANQEIDNDDNG